jgi:hypothetical protein
MIKLFSKAFNKFLQRENSPLLLIDGDGISPRYLSSLLENLEVDINNIKVHIFCNTNSVRSWVGCKNFSKAIYTLSPVEPQSADLTIKTTFIKLLTELHLSGDKYHKNIYLAADDTTFSEDLEYMAKIFNITVISNTPKLLNIPNVNSIPLKKISTNTLSQCELLLIKQAMSLVEVGHVLKTNGIKYHMKLTEFLIFQGFEVSNGRVSKIPLVL